MAIVYTYNDFGQVTPTDTNEAVLLSIGAGEELIRPCIVAVNIDSSEHTIRIGIDTDEDNAADIWKEYDSIVTPGIPFICESIKGLKTPYQIIVRTDSANNIHFSVSGLKKTTT